MNKIKLKTNMMLRSIMDEIHLFNLRTHIEHGITGWELDTKRQENIPWHKHTKIIKLFDHIPEEDIHIMDTVGTMAVNDYPNSWPVTHKFLTNFELLNNCKVVLASYVLLPAGKEIGLHPDIGKFFEMYDRHHFVIKGTYTLRIGDEKIDAKPGNVFWFDNTEWHDVVNVPDERITMIFDTKPLEGS